MWTYMYPLPQASQWLWEGGFGGGGVSWLLNCFDMRLKTTVKLFSQWISNIHKYHSNLQIVPAIYHLTPIMSDFYRIISKIWWLYWTNMTVCCEVAYFYGCFVTFSMFFYCNLGECTEISLWEKSEWVQGGKYSRTWILGIDMHYHTNWI